MDNPLFYIIVYPRGDRSKLSVAELCEGTRYEISDYAVASRQEFSDYQEAATYAKTLAKNNNLVYVGDSSEPDYLD